jgi:hypothetical protein
MIPVRWNLGFIAEIIISVTASGFASNPEPTVRCFLDVFEEAFYRIFPHRELSLEVF